MGGLAVGALKRTDGYCTHASILRGRSANELEDLLGYRRGRLAAGATILFLIQTPGPDDFQLAGYSYFSDGAVGGHKLQPEDRDPYRMENLLHKESGWSAAEIRSYKQKMIGRKIVIQGPQRLAKVVPTTAYAPGEKFPPGAGVFQVKVSRPLWFRVKASIAPGQKWLGDYQ